jgi:hypothetical protein
MDIETHEFTDEEIDRLAQALRFDGTRLSPAALSLPPSALHLPPGLELRTPADLPALFAPFAEALKPIWQALQALARCFVDQYPTMIVRLPSPLRQHAQGDGPHAHRRPRNTRVQRVQAKRRTLGLGQDGCIPGYSRKISYVLAQDRTSWLPPVFPGKRVRRRRARRFLHRYRQWQDVQVTRACECELCADRLFDGLDCDVVYPGGSL